MAQQYYFENDTQQTVNFSAVQNGDMFVFNSVPYIKLDNNNPNAAQLDNGTTEKMNDADQVFLPASRIIKFE